MEIQTQGYIKEKETSSKNCMCSLVLVTGKLRIFVIRKGFFFFFYGAIQNARIKYIKRVTKEIWFRI